MNLHWQTLSFPELTPIDLYAVLRLRQEIFVVEQQCAYLDLDNLDHQAIHIFCIHDAQVLAYQRCLPPGLNYPESSLGRVVVCPAMRGQQLGRALVQRGIEHNLQRWPHDDICISAQAHLQDFYAERGFTAEGAEYLEDNIAHRQMRYRTSNARSESR
jgi:ElaA protein